MAVQSVETRILKELEAELTAELKSKLPRVLRTYERITGRSEVTVHSLHGIIGGKNNEYTDAIRTQFSSPDDFNARWIQGLRKRVEEAGPYDNAATRIARLMKNRTIRDYTLTFLTRNFYRHLAARTRQKPKDHMWRLWFGDNRMPWGLFISPAYRNDEWTNDKSEIRRAQYDYWTVGHVLETGIIDPESEDLLEFDSIKSLRQFYQSVLARNSASQYEKELTKRYLQYLRNSTAPESEPFLIPELRYAGIDKKHRYRLDFTILNPHVMSFVGFEISPASTHMAVRGIRKVKKTQKAVNEELKEKWESEMSKRNRYFKKYGISTVTFTDNNLSDLDSCFDEMKAYLSDRPEEKMSLEAQIEAIEALDL